MSEEIKGNPPSTPPPDQPAAEKPAASEAQPQPPAVKAEEQVAPGKTGDVKEGKDPAAVKPAPPAPAAAAPSPGAPQSGATKTPTATDGTPAAGPAAGAPPKAAAPAKPAPPAGAAAPAKPPAAPAKPAGPTPQPWECDMVANLKRRFGSGIKEASTYVGQPYMVVDSSVVHDVLGILRDEDQFDYCVDLTAVHYPKREQQFDIVWILYSFPRNQRIRVKTMIKDGDPAPSVVDLWATANWLERECFDMFGIKFEGHPDLKRILLPDAWKGHPLRKEYGILQQDVDWVKANLGIESGQ